MRDSLKIFKEKVIWKLILYGILFDVLGLFSLIVIFAAATITK